MEFHLLTKEFYENYKECPEILKKVDRPYTIVLVELNNLTFAIPIRHNVQHKYSIITIENKGLDFTKAVVITREDYISKKIAYIDDEEFKILTSKTTLIKPKLERFLKIYKKAVKNQKDKRNRLLYEYSSLKYFHKELNIKN